MNDRLAEAERLLRIARRNYRSFLQLKLGGEEYATDAKLMAQQSVEKCLKAVLVANGMKAPHIHSLIDLATEVERGGIELPFRGETLDLLTPYAVVMRYEDEEILTLDYSEATKLVEGVFVWASKEIEERPL